METDNLSIKLIIVGPPGVGKTSIIERYTKNTFNSFYKSSIGVDFFSKKVTIDKKTLTVNLWDIAGQERFTSVTDIYYRNAIGAIVVYDIYNPESLILASRWRHDIDTKAFNKDTGKAIPTILVANKRDLVHETDIKNMSIEIENYAKENGYLYWSLVSAKKDINIDRVFYRLLCHVINNSECKDIHKNKDIVKLDNNNTKKSSKCC